MPTSRPRSARPAPARGLYACRSTASAGAPALLLGYGRIAEPAIDEGVRVLADSAVMSYEHVIWEQDGGVGRSRSTGPRR